MRKRIIVGSTRGDTIIEVLFAVTVFSLVAIGGISLMNKGTALAQRALEIGLVRQQMDAQADALRYLNRSYVNNYKNQASEEFKVWNTLTSTNPAVDGLATTSAYKFSEMVGGDNKCKMPISKVFALNVESLDMDGILRRDSLDESASTYAKVNREDTSDIVAEGIWVQAVRSAAGSSATSASLDFHIRACWHTPGQERPITLGTIVRLYEPK